MTAAAQRSLSAKVCLLGSFAVGKTSLVRRFVHDRFDDTYISTIGVKVSRKTLMVAREEGAVELNLLLWDLAGAEAYLLPRGEAAGLPFVIGWGVALIGHSRVGWGEGASILPLRPNPDHSSFKNRSYGPRQASGFRGAYSVTSNDRRTTSRASASEPSNPSPTACTSTLPAAVASTGPASTGRLQASAVSWFSRAF